MSPDQRSDRASQTLTACIDCGGSLEGNQMRCPPCVQAARTACQEREPGQTIRPSDIAAIREHMG